MADIGEMLRAARVELGLDQAELAARAATTQTYVSRVERGVTEPSLSTAERLFHAMGLRLRLTAEPIPLGNVSAAELRRDFLASTPEERVSEAMTLSSFITGVAAEAQAGVLMAPAENLDPRDGAEPRGLTKLDPVKLLDALRHHRVEFVIIGGFSLAAHGVVRATKDVDIVPQPTPANLKRLSAALRSIGAEPDIGEPSEKELDIEPDEEGLALGGNWVLKTDHGRLDVMQTVPGLRSWQQLRAGAVDLDGALYAGYDELISMKSASTRDEDLADIAKLRAARGEG